MPALPLCFWFMEPTHHTVHVESGVTLSCETQTVQVSDRVFAFQQIFNTDVQGHPSRFALNVGLPLPSTCFGFLDSGELDKLFHHQPFDRLDWVVVSNEELHAYRYSHDGLGVSEKELRQRNPVEWLKRDGMGPGNVVRPYSREDLLLGLDNRPLPTPVMLDLIDCWASEDTHDMEALAQLLLAHPDVRVLRQGAEQMDDLASTIEQALRTIPMNERMEGGVTHELNFFWHPSDEDFLRLWSRAIQNYPNSPHVGIREQLIKLDVLGLNATKRQPVSAG